VTARNIEEAREGYLAVEMPASMPHDQREHAGRVFMHGAMATLELLKNGVSREALFAELIDYGRSIGRNGAPRHAQPTYRKG
jgi:hypothetical protein